MLVRILRFFALNMRNMTDGYKKRKADHSNGRPEYNCTTSGVIFKTKVSIAADLFFGAEDEARTRDPNLGKVVLYQLSYFRRFVFQTCCSRLGLQRYAKNYYFQIFLQKNAQKMQKKSKKIQNCSKTPQIPGKNRWTNERKFVNLY